MADPISNFGQYEHKGRPVYDVKAGEFDKELEMATIFNPQYDMLKANVDKISIFPRKNK